MRARSGRAVIRSASFLVLLSMFGCSRAPNRVQAVIPQKTSLSSAADIHATPAPSPASPSPPLSTIVSQPASGAPSPLDKAPDPRALEQRYAQPTSTPEVRQEIIRALGEIKSRESVGVLSRLFQRERREELKIDILGTIGDLDDDKMLEPKIAFLFRAVTSTHGRLVREVAISALADIDDRRVIPLLQSLQSDSDVEIRSFAAEILRDVSR